MPVPASEALLAEAEAPWAGALPGRVLLGRLTLGLLQPGPEHDCVVKAGFGAQGGLIDEPESLGDLMGGLLLCRTGLGFRFTALSIAQRLEHVPYQRLHLSAPLTD